MNPYVMPNDLLIILFDTARNVMAMIKENIEKAKFLAQCLPENGHSILDDGLIQVQGRRDEGDEYNRIRGNSF